MKFKIGSTIKNKHTGKTAEVHGIETVQIKIGESVTVYVIIYEDGTATRSNEFYIKKNWVIINE